MNIRDTQRSTVWVVNASNSTIEQIKYQPAKIENAFLALGDNPEDVTKLGVELATHLCQELLDAGVPGLHFYTMNTANATLEIARNLGLDKRATR